MSFTHGRYVDDDDDDGRRTTTKKRKTSALTLGTDFKIYKLLETHACSLSSLTLLLASLIKAM
jgi:hypothetical protein